MLDETTLVAAIGRQVSANTSSFWLMISSGSCIPTIHTKLPLLTTLLPCLSVTSNRNICVVSCDTSITVKCRWVFDWWNFRFRSPSLLKHFFLLVVAIRVDRADDTTLNYRLAIFFHSFVTGTWREILRIERSDFLLDVANAAIHTPTQLLHPTIYINKNAGNACTAYVPNKTFNFLAAYQLTFIAVVFG